MRNWYHNNPEKVKRNKRNSYLRHRKKRIAKAIEWNKDHPKERSRIMVFQNAKRRSRIKSNGGRGFTRKHWDELLVRSRGLCAYCKKNKATSIDHFYPLSKGGIHDFVNIVPACRHCNSVKGSQLPATWMMMRFSMKRWNEIQKVRLPNNV